MQWRQLGLFKGKRQKGTIKRPKERSLHIAFADAVRVSLSPGWKFTHIPLGEYRTPETAGLLKRMGVSAGWPDFIFVGHAPVPVCKGIVAFIELKRPGERLSVVQDGVCQHLAQCGCYVLATDDINDALGFLRDIGALRSMTVMA